jgi:superfamily II DNA or RNA helicase
MDPLFAVCESDVADNMMEITDVDNVYIKIDCQNSIRQELKDFFSFEVANKKFMPKARNTMWDGRINLYSGTTGKIYKGLLPHVRAFAKQRDYKINYEEKEKKHISKDLAEKYFRKISKYEPRDYQIDSFHHCINETRSTLISPTASGKSLIIYALTEFYRQKPVLIIVPTIALVHQMHDDFVDYGGNTDNIHCVRGGVDPRTNKSIVISTWQSLAKLPTKYFDKYKCVIGDECHLYDSKSLTKILKNLKNCPYRFGFTGTLKDNSEGAHKLVIEGLFGRVKQFVNTKELMDNGYIAKLAVHCMVLQYPRKDCIAVSKMQYQDELDWIVTNPKRNRMLTNLAMKCNGNTLLLFQFVEKHGEVLFDLIKEAAGDARQVFFVSGRVTAEVREHVRKLCERFSNCIIVASVGVFSTGTSIRNLHNVVLCSPSKSRVRNLQSIGRSLRLALGKMKANVFDVVDDLKYEGRANYVLRHFFKRVSYYIEEKFDYRIKIIK